MPVFRYIKKSLTQSLAPSDYNVLAVGVIGAVGHPLFWLWWTYVDYHAYESFTLRLIGMLSCIFLLLSNKWPDKLKKYFGVYWFFVVLFTLPFFFIYYLIASNYSMLWSMGAVALVFFVITLLPNYLVRICNVTLGGMFAVFYAYLKTPELLYFDHDLFLLVYAPGFIFAIVAGEIFSFSNLKGLLAEEKIKNITAIAGSIAHEMRNPLGQVKYSLDNIERHLPNPTTQSNLQTLDTRHLNEIYSSLAQGQMAIKRGVQAIAMTLNELSGKPVETEHFEYSSAAKITQNVLEEYNFETEDERHKVWLQVKQDFTFKINETAYLLVLTNLLRNALYYIKLYPQATVTITIDAPAIIVKDTGPGISKQMQSNLFTPFSTSGKSGGTGLGLAYCGRVMQAFGGDISCKSEEGKYSEFQLNFPVISKAEIDNYEQSIRQQAAIALNGKRLLIVDDQTFMRKSTCTMLKDFNMVIDEAESGEAALQKLKQSTYDLILMDLNMPVLDGYAITEKIRKGVIPHTTHIPIIAYTSESAYLARVKTEKIGMNGFICKPCTQTDLLKSLISSIEHAAHNAKSNSAMESNFIDKIIIVADDNGQNRKIVKSYLKQWGVNAIEAEHGLAVLDLLKAGVKPNAILMDIEMPGLNGIETAKRIRSNPDNAYVPIIALTAHFGEAHILETSTAGMNDFISKPIDAGVLRDKLLDIFRSQLTTSLKNNSKKSSITMLEKQNALTQQVSDTISEAPPLLDTKHLEALREIEDGFLEECLSVYSQQITDQFQLIETHLADKNFEQFHHALHKLLGAAGGAGFYALHKFIRQQVYPDVIHHRWPSEDSWLIKTKRLYEQSLLEVQKIYLADLH